MTKNFIIITFFFFSQYCFSQSDINLLLNHQFNGQPLSYSQNYNDENGNAISISRIQYYLSSIEITHDGGILTPLNDVYVLTNGNVTNYNLGNYNISNVEKLEFDLGVDYAANHGNVSNYPSQHPLGPKSPTMDWGWPAGYFFLVINGMIDDNADGIPNKPFQLHSLGDIMLQDVNYLNGTFNQNNNLINLSLDVNVEDWLTGINLINVGIDHSSSNNNQTMCNNTVINQVFQTSSLTDINNQEHNIFITTDYTIEYAPTINYKLDLNSKYDLKILNIEGKKIIESKNIGSEGNYFIRKELPAGIYFAIFSNNIESHRHKFVIKN